ncbi:MAG: glycosyltransferase [Acidobacteriales bacterium]|nr:glycosyltransferase [Terriglobales bacterium]
MKIVIFGLSISSSWGNGHATTFRALAKALRARGHQIVFFEHDLEWYGSNRDLPEPPFCELRVFESWNAVLPEARRHLRDADVAMVGSYFPDGIAAIDEVLQSSVPVKTFYDIDTPITMARLRSGSDPDYLLRHQIPGFDVYFSFTGGPVLRELERELGAQKAVPLYCSVDPEQYRSWPPNRRFVCELSYMGTYAPDRQPKLDQLLCEPARQLPAEKFIVAGPQYPRSMRWPKNVRRIHHLNPRWHPQFYSSSRLTLNVTRREMVLAGYSPSVRLFEAGACAATIASDNWAGLDEFFAPGEEILLPTGSEDILRYIKGYDTAELRAIGERAQARVLAEHTNQQRARQFEDYVESVSSAHEVNASAGDSHLVSL